MVQISIFSHKKFLRSLFGPKVKILLLTDEQGYVKQLNNYCASFRTMSSTNVNDAKKECSKDHSRCYMFYDDEGAGERFLACRSTAAISATSFGSILYKPAGNTTFAQFSI